MGGTIDVNSKLGKGTTFSIKVVMLCKVSDADSDSSSSEDLSDESFEEEDEHRPFPIAKQSDSRVS